MPLSAAKTIQDPAKYSRKTTKIDDAEAEIQRIVRLQGDPLFVSRQDFGDACILQHMSPSVTSKQTLWSCFVYSMAKLMMREFCDLLNAYFGPTGWRFLYTDTDSVVLSVYEHEGGPTLFGFMRDHGEWLNLAGYPVWHSLYDPRFPKLCTPSPDTVGHGKLDIEDVGVPSALGFCEHHLQEQHACPNCITPADKPCAKHKWSNTCPDCVACADKWKDEPSMCFDLCADGPKLYRVRIVKDIVEYQGNDPVGTLIVENVFDEHDKIIASEVVAIVGTRGLIVLKSKIKTKGIGRAAAGEVFNAQGEAKLNSGQGVEVKFERIGQERHNDGTNPKTTNLINVKKRVGCAGICGGKGKRRRVACSKHDECVDACAWCYEHEAPFAWCRGTHANGACGVVEHVILQITAVLEEDTNNQNMY